MKSLMKWVLVGMTVGMLWGTAWGAEVDVSVTNVMARQRYPWNGMVDIDYELACSDPGTNVTLYVSARDSATGKAMALRTVRLENGTFGEALVVRSGELPGGKGRLVWDAGKDTAGMVSEAMTVEVGALAGMGDRLYMVVDLANGSGDDSSWEVSYLNAVPDGGWTDEYKTTKLVLRLILPGTFMMGSPIGEFGRYESELQHQATLTKPFYIGVFEITQAQWELVMGMNPSYFTNKLVYAKRPVEEVFYADIRGDFEGSGWPKSREVDGTSFMGRLRARVPGFMWDLPTETQWEFACRAETTTALNHGKDLTGKSSCTNLSEVGRYWFNGGQNFSALCDTSAGSAEVGSYRPNAWGLYDMHGNVWEWCLDWYDNYGMEPTVDSGGGTVESYRILRGGSWATPAEKCRTAYRFGSSGDLSFRKGSQGFRLACPMGL